MANELCSTCKALEISSLLAASLEESADPATATGAIVGPPKDILNRPDCRLCRLIGSVIKAPYDAFLGSRRKQLSPEEDRLVELIPTHFDAAHKPVGSGRHKPTPPLIAKRLGIRLRSDAITGYDASADVVGHIAVHDRHARKSGRLAVADEIDVDAIAGWLDRCTQKHDVCWRLRIRREKQPSVSEGFWVVDVVARRVVPADHRTTRYVALSYVWGPSHGSYKHFANLVEGGGPGVQRYVPLPEILPRTLADAMEFCQRLGERFLWIDALCIDQRDAKMKAAVIANMHLIYMGATFTLVTLAGGSADAPLPGLKRGTRPRPVEVPIGATKATLSLPLPTLEESLNDSVWKTRGWTYQEGCLSSRCIIVSRREVFLACPDGVFRESITPDTPAAVQHPKALPLGDAAAARIFLCGIAAQQSSGFTEAPYRALDDFLQTYRARQLSFETDRINAISGVLFTLPTGFRFWYGLPAENGNLAKGLMWAAGGGTAPKRGGLFPSVSWADWTAAPKFGYLDNLIFSDLADVAMPDGPGPGEPQPSELVYRGSRARVRFQELKAGSGAWRVDDSRHIDALFFSGIAYSDIKMVALDGGMSDEETEEVRTHGAECLYLGTSKEEYCPEDRPNVVTVLLVARRAGTNGSERIGVACLTEPAWLAAGPVETRDTLK